MHLRTRIYLGGHFCCPSVQTIICPRGACLCELALIITFALTMYLHHLNTDAGTSKLFVILVLLVI